MAIIPSHGVTAGASAGGSSLLGPLGIGLMVGSTIFSGIAQQKAAKAAQKAAALNSFAARIATEFKVQDLMDAGRRLASTQRAIAAKSGVDIGSGSAVEVMNSSAAQIEKEIFRAKYTGNLKARGAQMEADAYGDMANNAKLAAFLSAGAKGISGASEMEKWKVKT